MYVNPIISDKELHVNPTIAYTGTIKFIIPIKKLLANPSKNNRSKSKI